MNSLQGLNKLTTIGGSPANALMVVGNDKLADIKVQHKHDVV